ncbi:hypothetical protein TL16_g06932 [Triparma laevis f. inornata]|uniref:Uncharacterized protein n=1 Tax=Triparma laevis f. inornata TaxID=1714386 RepID=A0A9W7AR54_9STRA|nr:hypothetical protein TL16_g06932 [Triparma laevis f. inornata]
MAANSNAVAHATADQALHLARMPVSTELSAAAANDALKAAQLAISASTLTHNAINAAKQTTTSLAETAMHVVEAVEKVMETSQAATFAANTAASLAPPFPTDALLPPAEDDGVWDIEVIYSNKVTTSVDAELCQTPDCGLPACAMWKCKDETWRTCESCQVTDFGGWPVNVPKNQNSNAAKNSNKGKDHTLLDDPYMMADAPQPPAGSFEVKKPKPSVFMDTDSDSDDGKGKKRPAEPTSGENPIVSPSPKKKGKSKKLTEIEKKWEAEAKKFDKNAKIILTMPPAIELVHKVRSEKREVTTACSPTKIPTPKPPPGRNSAASASP